MSITNTDICNMALSQIAVGSIISMDESSEAAKQCKIHYEHTRRRILGMYNWNFAARETKLALLDKTVPGFAYVYAYPEECLKIYYVYEEGMAPYKEEHPRDYRIAAITGVRRAVITDFVVSVLALECYHVPHPVFVYSHKVFIFLYPFAVFE